MQEKQMNKVGEQIEITKLIKTLSGLISIKVIII